MYISYHFVYGKVRLTITNPFAKKPEIVSEADLNIMETEALRAKVFALEQELNYFRNKCQYFERRMEKIGSSTSPSSRVSSASVPYIPPQPTHNQYFPYIPVAREINNQ